MKIPVVNERFCVGCGICADGCPNDVIEVSDNVARVVQEKSCGGCNACAENCPNDAIVMKEV